MSAPSSTVFPSTLKELELSPLAGLQCGQNQGTPSRRHFRPRWPRAKKGSEYRWRRGKIGGDGESRLVELDEVGDGVVLVGEAVHPGGYWITPLARRGG